MNAKNPRALPLTGDNAAPQLRTKLEARPDCGMDITDAIEATEKQFPTILRYLADGKAKA